MSNVHFYGCRAENMSSWSVPSIATNCSIHDYRLIGTLLKNYSNTTLITTGNMFRDGITMSNRIEGVVDTTTEPSKISIAYTASSDSGLGVNDGSLQINKVKASDSDTGIFGYLRYQGNVKIIGVNGLYRTSTGSPVGYITPKFIGEELLCSVNNHIYKANGNTANDWLDISSNAQFRTSNSNPTSYVTPKYTGEELLDTTNKIWYKAAGVTANDWVALNT